MAVAVAALHLAWAFGAEIGISQPIAAKRTSSSAVMNSLDAAIMIAGALGVLMIVHGRGRMPFWIPLTMAWVGGGFLFAWGLWHMVVVLGNTPLARGGGMALVNFASLVRLIAGLIIGVLMLFLIAESKPAVTPVVLPRNSGWRI
jgi:hypothetical protein